MASCLMWASYGALLVGLALAAGCKAEREKFPPPQPYSGGNAGAQGGAGGDGGASGGATTGSGGATTTMTGPPPVLNVCECAFGMVDSAACGACVNDAVAPAQSCFDVQEACDIDPTCKGVFDCKLQCVGKPDAEQVTCVQGCYAMVDLTAAENQAFVDLIDCVCPKCAIKCAPSMAITCE